MRKFILAGDHGGFGLKKALLARLQAHFPDYRFDDAGCYDENSVDYPDLALKACQAVVANDYEAALLFCGTGIGISIAANKVAGIRCAHLSDTYSAAKAKQHNNANAIALGGRVLGEDLAFDIIVAYLTAEFEGGRHAKRVMKITAIEADQKKSLAKEAPTSMEACNC